MPPITKQHMFLLHTVVLKGIAVFFYSTYSLPIPNSPPKHSIFFKFSSYNMIFYFHFEGRDILYCPTKTILNPPVIVFCKDMKLTSPKNISK